MRNLHRIMGARFEHEKPNLCPTCVFRREYGEWQGYCTAKRKVLSVATGKVKKPRCKDYSAASAREVEAEAN